MAIKEDYLDYEQIDSEDELQIHMRAEQNTVAPKPVHEVLAEAISNETTDEAHVRFTNQFSTMANGKAINREITDSMKYLMGNKLAKKTQRDMMDTYETPKNCKEMIINNNHCSQSQSTHLGLSQTRCMQCWYLTTEGINAATQEAEKVTKDDENAVTCFAAANVELYLVRYDDLMKPGLNLGLAQLCKPSVAVSEFLFGDDL